ncbi:hypothetical protein CUR178_07717 [Leishmania enriettii]|uniref:Uncharacterized protein n=1 Tax=Leishmania enriettii TaxID=5663 RepID=A0A836GQP1_LEIEN|nr:hypothetical protein CUR178_07706 [Leishmania enriettii]KAG5486395.1 hypothetical protein CUR178_07710 [Leishmania enriettii]KAG5486396.1 hypothetical protein CUR178_07711 [Leishmania enriettii]KAG5486399.1 hypothetical protein CUR178_07714 [Leishmania enriettii]KAG5486402.1 hypothetical protein CUR178_07717 [Leishmania enriettii]
MLGVRPRVAAVLTDMRVRACVCCLRCDSGATEQGVRARRVMLGVPRARLTHRCAPRFPLRISCVRSSPVGAMTSPQPTMRYTSPARVRKEATRSL